MDNNVFMSLPNISHEEFIYLSKLTSGFDEARLRNFIIQYGNRRKDPRTIMLATLLGLFVVAGIQRFLLNQTGIGVLYLLTGGLCFIGTIIDLVNYNSMTYDYNKQQAWEICELIN